MSKDCMDGTYKTSKTSSWLNAGHWLTKVGSDPALAQNPQHVHLIVNWINFRSFEALASHRFALKEENVLAVLLARSSICWTRVCAPMESSPVLTGMFSTIGCAKKWGCVYAPLPLNLQVRLPWSQLSVNIFVSECRSALTPSLCEQCLPPSAASWTDRNIEWKCSSHFPLGCMDTYYTVPLLPQRKPRTDALNCGAGEDSWESLGLQGDPTSPS